MLSSLPPVVSAACAPAIGQHSHRSGSQFAAGDLSGANTIYCVAYSATLEIPPIAVHSSKIPACRQTKEFDMRNTDMEFPFYWFVGDGPETKLFRQ
ncbi:hypothetical protein [Azoarcus sp. DD4]|uniref:hypothetical protein n=1 Tax=Azoarcus sp. DD4 TaxID=2027405 RepID=UPI00112D399C|nr:hypothetical protein [Azoarcus sp. DD4]